MRFYASEAQLAAAFEGRGKFQADLPRHHVAFFRDREEYNQALGPKVPKLDITIGMYMPDLHEACFFAAKEEDDRTLYHEATHQLFQEIAAAAPDLGRQGNFWVVEGVAMLMESFHTEDGFYVIGGANDDRLYAARFRLLQDNFYVPLAELTTYARSGSRPTRGSPRSTASRPG